MELRRGEDRAHLVEAHVVGWESRVRGILVQGKLEVLEERKEGEDTEDDEGGEQQQVGQAPLLVPSGHPGTHRSASSRSPELASKKWRWSASRLIVTASPRSGRAARCHCRTTTLVPSSNVQITWVSAPNCSTRVTEARMPPVPSDVDSGRTPSVTGPDGIRPDPPRSSMATPSTDACPPSMTAG